MSVRKN